MMGCLVVMQHCVAGQETNTVHTALSSCLALVLVFLSVCFAMPISARAYEILHLSLHWGHALAGLVLCDHGPGGCVSTCESGDSQAVILEYPLKGRK